jgi:hypothetical protein
MDKLQQLQKFAEWEHENRPAPDGKQHIAAWAANEIERLRAALAKANGQAERFERGWYLRGDALEAIKTHCEPQPSALAAAIVATCDNGLKA